MPARRPDGLSDWATIRCFPGYATEQPPWLADGLPDVTSLRPTDQLSTTTAGRQAGRPVVSCRGERDAVWAHQAEVLALLVTAASDAEIAAQLGLSVRTVEHHVAAILRKKQVSTRTALRSQ